MRIVEILKRKDGSSVVVGVVLAIVAATAVQALTVRPADWLSGINGNEGGFREGLWRPLIGLVVSLIIFELLIRIYLWLSSGQTVSKKK